MLKQADIAQALQSAGVNVFNLSVKDIGGFSAVYGQVASQADKQKAEQAIEAKLGKISNHLEVTGASTTAGGLGGVADPAKGARTYTVKSGDTLSKIAKEFYGDASQWKKIHQANTDRIKDPDKIQVGWTLQIPQ
jgi:nucleoid-associated protein YgaU